MKKLIYISLAIPLLFLISSFIPKFKPTFALKTVVIDAGHGGKDPGCHGDKYKEKDVALAVALKLGSFIEKNLKDVKVVYTRTTDVFIELQERANIANKAKADLFICIHCNSACYRDKKLKKDICKDYVHGAETYVMGLKNEQGKLDVAKRENSAILLEDNYVQKYDGFDPNSDESYIIMSMFTDTYLNQSLKFAAKLQEQYTTKAGRKDKGVKRASLWVLWRTYMPSVLTEIGYLTNPDEEKFLGSAKGQEYVAACIFRAFRNYKDEIEGVSRKYDDDFEKMPAVAPITDSIEITDEEVEDDTLDIKIDETKKPDNKEAKSTDTKEKPVDQPAGQVVVKKEPVAEKPKAEKKEEPTETIVSPISNKNIVVEKKSENNTPSDTNKPKEIASTNIDSAKKTESEKKTEAAKPVEKVIDQPVKKENPVNNSVLKYKVQIVMSEKKLEPSSDKFKGAEKIDFYLDKGIYKYTAGDFENLTDAKKYLEELRIKGFKDAFIIKMQNGKRIL